MDARTLLRRLTAAGFDLRVKDGGSIGVSPASDLTEWMSGLVRERKSELLDLLERGVEFEEYPPCVDCSDPLPLGGVRCPTCRDAYPESACTSCGAEVPGPDLSICDLCELEAARLTEQEVEEP